jgi:hypothetical protein
MSIKPVLVHIKALDLHHVILDSDKQETPALSLVCVSADTLNTATQIEQLYSSPFEFIL